MQHLISLTRVHTGGHIETMTTILSELDIAIGVNNGTRRLTLAIRLDIEKIRAEEGISKYVGALEEQTLQALK